MTVTRTLHFIIFVGPYRSCLLSSTQPDESEILIVLGIRGTADQMTSPPQVQFVSHIINLFTWFAANVTAWRLTMMQETLGQYL